MACEHPNDRKVDDFCFECWHIEHERKRDAMRRQVSALLSHSATILETLPNGAMVDWLMVPFGDGKVETYHHDSGRRDYAFSVPFTADKLAEHLESRAHGFGFLLHVYCFDCSDELIPLPLAHPDFDPDDPVCAKCAKRRAKLAEISDAADVAEAAAAAEALERNKP